MFRTIWESENKAHAETIFVFVFNYVSKVSFDEPSCCIRFVETASLNLVSERFVPLSFFEIEDIKYTFIFPHTTVGPVIFNISQVMFLNIHETFALYKPL